MKPSKIKPGQKICINGHIAYYMRRYPAQAGRSAINMIRVPEYAGLNGPDDDGTCQMSDYEFSRKVSCAPNEGIEASEGATAMLKASRSDIAGGE